MASSQLPLTRACEKYRAEYAELWRAFLRGEIDGGRTPTGRILLNGESVELYLSERRARASVSAA